jgi:hypothetical protein
VRRWWTARMPWSITSSRARRLGWLMVAVALTAFVIYEVVVHDLGPLPIIVFAVVPDLTAVFGSGWLNARGEISPPAVPAYTLAHRLAIPLVLIGTALVALLGARVLVVGDAFESARRLPLVAYVAGLTWLAHIALHRAFGLGMASPRRGSAGRPQAP